MTSDETKKLTIGQIILLEYGNGTQVARVRRVTRTGSVEVDRLWCGKEWRTSKAPVAPVMVLGEPDRFDPRLAFTR